MNRLRIVFLLALSACMVLASGGVGTAAAKQLQAPKNVVASATSMSDISVTFAAVSGASSYTVFLYPATGKNAQAYPNASPSGTTIGGLTTCTAYRVSVQAISTSRTVLSSVQTGKIAVTTQCNPALVPTFATPAPTADGFTVQITNYDAAFNWTVSVTAGSAAIDGSGLVTVTGLVDDASQTLTVTTTRVTYDNGSATVSAARNATPTRWIGAGDFTVEFWVKPTVDWFGRNRQELFALRPTSYNARFDIAYDSLGWTIFDFNLMTPAGAVPRIDMPPPVIGSWTHIAMTRQSGTLRLYVAGQRIIESLAVGDVSGLNQILLGGDPYRECGCNLASALLSNVRVVDGTALYTGSTLTVPTSPLTSIAGTTFLLNTALSQPTVGSVMFDGATKHEQTIDTTTNPPTLSSFDAFHWNGATWLISTVVTSTDSPFNVCGSNGLRANGSACQVGDRGPGGGTIFYVSAAGFTSTGSPCNTNCHFLEVAPVGWATLAALPYNTTDYQQSIPRSNANIDPYLIWWYGPSRQPPENITTGLSIGTGMTNTLALKAATTPDVIPSSGQSRFAFDAALNYATSGTLAGEWFLPSIGELNELCKFANGQIADLGTLVSCSDGISGTNIPALGFVDNVIYWSSSHPAMDKPYPYPVDVVPSVNQTPGYNLKRTLANVTAYSGYFSVYGEYVRPIRAF